MGNFDFSKVWWGGGQYRLVGGQLPPLAPMVATALDCPHNPRRKALEGTVTGIPAFTININPLMNIRYLKQIFLERGKT